MRLVALHQSADLIISNRYPKLTLANHVLDDINLIAIAMRNTMILDDPEKIRAELDLIPTARKNIDKNLGQLDQKLSTSQRPRHPQAHHGRPGRLSHRAKTSSCN